MKLRTRKLAVFVTCLGVAAAFPVLSSADRGGKPHSNNGNNHGKACPGKGKGRVHKKKAAPNHGNGKKCGFAPLVTGTTTITIPTTTGVAAPTGSTSTETETNSTTTTVSTVSGT